MLGKSDLDTISNLIIEILIRCELITEDKIVIRSYDLGDLEKYESLVISDDQVVEEIEPVEQVEQT
jgi:hypothetical protein